MFSPELRALLSHFCSFAAGLESCHQLSSQHGSCNLLLILAYEKAPCPHVSVLQSLRQMMKLRTVPLGSWSVLVSTIKIDLVQPFMNILVVCCDCNCIYILACFRKVQLKGSETMIISLLIDAFATCSQNHFLLIAHHNVTVI
jgi:hypothetical protein